MVQAPCEDVPCEEVSCGEVPAPGGDCPFTVATKLTLHTAARSTVPIARLRRDATEILPAMVFPPRARMLIVQPWRIIVCHPSRSAAARILPPNAPDGTSVKFPLCPTRPGAMPRLRSRNRTYR